MALNVEQITNRLAQMPDAALQKYAAMNKNDPYIMALAVSESNRRKQMRQAAQGAQGQMPQPKVVDAAVQNMAAPMPEDMGIARLPAGDMNFADGGIVAFADGGDVERYQVGGTTARNPYAFLNPGDLFGGIGRIFSEGIDPVAAEQRRQAALRKLVAPAEETVGTPEFAAAQQILKDKATAEGRTLPGETPPAPAPALPGAQPTATAPAAATPSTGGIESIFKRLQTPMEQELTAVRKNRETFARSLQDFAKKEEADFEAAEAKRGDVFKGREERLAKREGELAGRKDQNLGLALLQAGAAIMSTPGSLGMALGKGVDVGAKQYAAGIDKLNAAQERLMDARDRLEELRVNREDMTAKERRQLKSNINRSVLEGEKLFLDGAEKDLGYRREDMKTLFSGLVTDMASQRSAAATAAAANRTPAEIQLIERIAKERKIPFAQAYQEVASMKREPMSVENLRKDWLDPAKRMQIAQDYPNVKTFEDYATVMGVGGGGSSAFRVVGVRD